MTIAWWKQFINQNGNTVMVSLFYLQFVGLISPPTTTTPHPGREAMCMTSVMGGATVVITVQELTRLPGAGGLT